jgi:hypothetical protein
MTRPRLFHTGAPPASSRLPGILALASSTTAPRSLCLLPTPPPPTYASSTRRWPQLGSATLMDTNAGGLHLQHETLECNTHLKQMKIFRTYACNMGVKHMQHPDKTIATSKNTYCNIRLKQLKHLEHTVATYV